MTSKFITGKTGVGKTYLAKQYLKEMKDKWPEIKMTFSDPNWAREPEHFKFYSCPELMLEARIPKRALELLKEITTAYFVILDDFGVNKQSNYNTDIIYIAINKRIESGKITIVTSNLSIKQIDELIDDRLASRLASFEQIELVGSDRRVA